MAFKIGPYTVTRGALKPYKERSKTAQKVTVATDGQVVVNDVLYKEEFIEAKVVCLRTEGENIKGFLENGVRYSAIPFTLVDGFSRTVLVRYWGGTVEIAAYGGDLVELNLKFRKEVA